jgi:hypothetical protein
MMTMHDAVIMRTTIDLPSEQMTSLDAPAAPRRHHLGHRTG